MNTFKINKHFQKIGTRLEVVEAGVRRGRVLLPPRDAAFTIDVKPGHRGEYIELRHRIPLSVIVQDVQSDQKHLLLQVVGGGQSRKFLIGHDERHYFVAGVEPNTRDVLDAMHRLQPPEVREKAQKLPKAERFARRNEVFKRQGEWFFVPVSTKEMYKIDENLVIESEPLRRGRSKPHLCEQLYRTGGVDVMFHVSHAPNGITQEEYAKLDKEIHQTWGWRKMRRDAQVYVKGKVSHVDHAPLLLKGWHRVYMNGEVMMEEVAFLD